jgi:membrane fusion protein, multidrug efflux system
MLVSTDLSSRLARRRRIVLIIGFLVMLAAAAISWRYWAEEPGAARAALPAGRAAPAVPVRVAIASRQDLPIYATGLGTVSASFTIGIHSQLDGIMQEVLFKEGQHVKKGDVLAQIDRRPFQAVYDAAKAKRAQDAAMLISAEKDLTRAKTLVIRSFETQQTVDQTQAKVDQLKASIEADEASIEAAKTNLDFTSITAPSDGRVGVRQIDPGNLVHASDTRQIASLVLTQPSAVMFTLPAQVLDDVRDAMARGPVEVTALDQNNRRELSTGTLLLIDNAIDQSTATIRLKAMFANTDERLWPGEFVNARVLMETRHDAVAIPTEAIQRGQPGLYVWVVNADNVVEPRTVTLGPASNDVTVIEKGIADGDRVVTDGQYKLQVNAKVRILPSAATAEAGK